MKWRAKRSMERHRYHRFSAPRLNFGKHPRCTRCGYPQSHALHRPEWRELVVEPDGRQHYEPRPRRNIFAPAVPVLDNPEGEKP